MKPPHLRIRSKAFLLVATLLAGIVAITALMLIKAHEASLEEELRQTRDSIRAHLSERAQLLASAERSFVERVLPEHQLDLIASELLALMQGQRGVRYGILMSSERQALFHPVPDRVMRVLGDERALWAASQEGLAEREFTDEGEPILEVSVPIMEDDIDPETGRDVRRRAATLRFGFSMGELNLAMRDADERHRQLVSRSWRLAGALSGVALLAGLVLAYLLGDRLVRPIEQLTRQAEAIARGNLDQAVSATSGDEIGRLATSFEEMRRGVRDLLARTAEKARMESELQTARAVQKALLPAGDPSTPLFDIAAYYEPATETGGDWYAYLPGRGDTVYFVVGDVTGHGAAAALVAAAARSVCSTLASGVEAGLVTASLTPGAILEMLNLEMANIGDRDHMMTAAVVCLDMRTGALQYANAAHNKPLVLRRDGEVRVLDGSGPVLGEDRSSRYSAAEGQLLPGETLLLYTDGLIENVDARDRQWGRRRLVDALRSGARHHRARRVADEIRASAVRFYGEVPIHDDVTFVVVRAREPMGASIREPGTGRGHGRLPPDGHRTDHARPEPGGPEQPESR